MFIFITQGNKLDNCSVIDRVVWLMFFSCSWWPWNEDECNGLHQIKEGSQCFDIERSDDISGAVRRILME